MQAEKNGWDVDGFKFEIPNGVILLQKYTRKTEITQGKHWENAGNFTRRVELESWLD